MAPLNGVFHKPPFWHVDAARGPSTPSFDHLVGACEQHRFVSLTRSSMLLDCLAIAVSVLLSAGIRNAWAITLGSSPAQGRLVASYLAELVLQIAHLHPNVPGWENGRIRSSGARS